MVASWRKRRKDQEELELAEEDELVKKEARSQNHGGRKKICWL